MNTKSTSARTMHRLYSLLAVCAVVVVVLIGTIMHVQNLNMRIAALEKQATDTNLQLGSYKRSLCKSNPEMATTEALTKYIIESAGFTRTYQVHTPANYDPTVRYPVILSFDGIEGSGARMEGYSNLDELPAVVVYPDALDGKLTFTAWEGAPYSSDGDRDVQFVGDILKTLPSQRCIDSTRIYTVGMSNGGAFANAVGCKLGNQIKAVASVSGAYYSTCKQEERTPSLLVVHSQADMQAPFKGVTARRLPPVPNYVEKQVAERRCSAPVKEIKTNVAEYYKWQGCDDNSLIQFVVLRDQPHGWLELPQVELQYVSSSAGYIWNFFEEATFSN